MALKERLVSVTFTLGEGAFGESGSNSVKLSNLRTSIKISKAGGNAMSSAQAQIYGMTLSMMNQLSTLGMVPKLVRRNTILIEAGDDPAALATVFIGTIVNAWFDGQSSPQVVFNVEAHSGLLEAVSHSPPKSYTGPTDVAVVLSSLAAEMNMPFENSGVSVILSQPYYYGSPRNQALAAVKDAGIEWNGLDNNILAIWPSGQSRGGNVPVISPTTGLVGYPTFTSIGIQFRTLFNPSLGLGNRVQLENSILDTANGLWTTYLIDYTLESQMPEGQWFADVMAAPPGYGPVVTQ